MGSHFHDWIDYNGVAFSIDLLERGRTFSNFGVKKFFIFTVSKRTRIFVLWVKKSVLHSIYSKLKNGSIHFRMAYLSIITIHFTYVLKE